jgi:Bacterial SH3 domain
MKKYIFIALVLLQTIGLMAQTSRFKDGETLNVWATSGLNMRDKPDAKSAKIAVIPYGAKVIVQPNMGVKIPFEIEEFKDFTVKGYWLLVKYGNTEGFVFDGFLSLLPMPTKKKEYGDIGEYLAKLKKVGGKTQIKKCQEPDFKNDTCEFTQKYELGIIYTNIAHIEVGDSFLFKIPNGSLFEAYMLVKFYFYDAESYKMEFDSKTKIVKILPEDEGVGCHSYIKKEGNYIVIDNYCGC